MAAASLPNPSPDDVGEAVSTAMAGTRRERHRRRAGIKRRQGDDLAGLAGKEDGVAASDSEDISPNKKRRGGSAFQKPADDTVDEFPDEAARVDHPSDLFDARMSDNDGPSSPPANGLKKGRNRNKEAKKSKGSAYDTYGDNAEIIIMFTYDDSALPLDHPDQARMFRVSTKFLCGSRLLLSVLLQKRSGVFKDPLDKMVYDPVVSISIKTHCKDTTIIFLQCVLQMVDPLHKGWNGEEFSDLGVFGWVEHVFEDFVHWREGRLHKSKAVFTQGIALKKCARNPAAKTLTLDNYIDFEQLLELGKENKNGVFVISRSFSDANTICMRLSRNADKDEKYLIGQNKAHGAAYRVVNNAVTVGGDDDGEEEFDEQIWQNGS